jgi:paraquat-inducible protein B
MSRKVSPVAVGGFILGTLALGIALLLFFSGNNFWSAKQRYTLVYDSSIKGLNIGAPVTLKGVKIGQVTDIRATFYAESQRVLNEVTIEINPDTLTLEGDERSALDNLLAGGLSAQLRMQSLLTGLLYVDADLRPQAAATTQPVKTRHPQIPTVPTDLERITRDLENVDVAKLSNDLQQIVDGLNQLVNDPALRGLASELSQTLQSMRGAVEQLSAQSQRLEQRLSPLAGQTETLLATLNGEIPALARRLDGNLDALQVSLQAMQRAADNTAYLTSEDSPLVYRINNAASNVSEAANEIKRLADTLERQPESVLFGKPHEGEL